MNEINDKINTKPKSGQMIIKIGLKSSQTSIVSELIMNCFAST